MYHCCRCGYCSKIKTQYVRHLKRKKECEPRFSNKSVKELLKEVLTNNEKREKKEETENVLNQCKFCLKKYSRKCHLSRHMKTCNVVKKMKNMEEKIVSLTNKINNLNKYPNVTTINNNVNVNNTINVNNTLNVVINNYGNENMDFITSDFLDDLIKIPFGSVQNLVETLHFSENHPENHNIKINNKKLPYASIYRNNKWELINKKECLVDIVDRSYMIIDLHYNEEGHINLQPNQKKRYEKFQNLYDNDDQDLKRKLVMDTELVILNNGNQ